MITRSNVIRYKWKIVDFKWSFWSWTKSNNIQSEISQNVTVFRNIYNQIYSRFKLSHWILIIQKIVDDSILFSKSINNRQYILIGLYLKIQQRAFLIHQDSHQFILVTRSDVKTRYISSVCHCSKYLLHRLHKQYDVDCASAQYGERHRPVYKYPEKYEGNVRHFLMARWSENHATISLTAYEWNKFVQSVDVL